MNKEEKIRRKIVHIVIIHSYLTFFIAVVIGLIINSFFNIEIFHSQFCQYCGVVGILLGTALVFWAQNATNRAGKIKTEEINTDSFRYGPYKYIHHPIYLGLFIMTLGLSLSLNSLPSFILVVAAFTLVKLVFKKKEEKILEEKYGQIFTDYKNGLKK